MSSCQEQAFVRRRHVYFLSGFDPKGAAHYHRIYAEQAALQGAVSGTAYQVSQRKNCDNGNAVWTVRSGDTETIYEYVRWDDVVRAQWPRGAWQVLWSGLVVYALVLQMPAALFKTGRVAWRTLVALFYPLFFGLWVLALAWAAAVGVKAGVSDGMLAGAAEAVRWGLAVLAGVGVVCCGFWLEQRLHTSWLVRIFRFADRYVTDRVPDLPKRWDDLAEQIQSALRDPEVDEVLLVGFSVGSIGAVSAAARTVNLCRDTPWALGKLSVLTLGHCIPLFALMPKAQALREELACVGADHALFWIDFSSPSDWGSFALVDPVAMCAGPQRGGSAGQAGVSINPRAMMSPRFHTLFDPANYARIQKNKRRMHLQYLMAGDLPGVYDYFSMTAGGMGLRQRHFQKAVG